MTNTKPWIYAALGAVSAAALTTWYFTYKAAPATSLKGADQPIIIADGSLLMFLNPLRASFTFDDFTPKPPYTTGPDVISIQSAFAMDLASVEVESAGTVTSYCQATNCTVEIDYGTLGNREMSAVWVGSSGLLTINFPGRPLNQWIHWEGGSKVVLRSLAAAQTIKNVSVNGTSVCTSGCRVILHVSPR